MRDPMALSSQPCTWFYTSVGLLHSSPSACSSRSFKSSLSSFFLIHVLSSIKNFCLHSFSCFHPSRTSSSLSSLHPTMMSSDFSLCLRRRWAGGDQAGEARVAAADCGVSGRASGEGQGKHISATGRPPTVPDRGAALGSGVTGGDWRCMVGPTS